MKSQEFSDTDVQTIASLEFESVCEAVQVDPNSKEIVGTCSRTAKYVVVYHTMMPNCRVTSKLVCRKCRDGIALGQCISCEEDDRLISCTKIKGATN